MLLFSWNCYTGVEETCWVSSQREDENSVRILGIHLCLPDNPVKSKLLCICSFKAQGLTHDKRIIYFFLVLITKRQWESNLRKSKTLCGSQLGAARHCFIVVEKAWRHKCEAAGQWHPVRSGEMDAGAHQTSQLPSPLVTQSRRPAHD